MNAHTSSRFFPLAIPLIVLALGACSGGDESAAPPAPAVQGMSDESADPATTDTIDLRSIGYALGEEDAPVEVYEFSDFGCPFCGMFARGTFPELREEFIASGRVRWTYVPVTFGFPGGGEGARAAECAAEQGKFWEMHDLLYASQDDWKGSRSREALAGAYADRIGLDQDAFSGCYREDLGRARTAMNNRAAGALRVRATPTFFIDGRLVEGALPVEQFRQILTAQAGER